MFKVTNVKGQRLIPDHENSAMTADGKCTGLNIFMFSN